MTSLIRNAIAKPQKEIETFFLLWFCILSKKDSWVAVVNYCRYCNCHFHIYVMHTKRLLLLGLGCCCALFLCAQTSGRDKRDTTSIFDKIFKSVSQYKVDTTVPPDDKITRTIATLRTLRGGFNIMEAIDFKLEEDRRKGEMPPAEIEALARFFKEGSGRQKLDNAVTWIYRKHFTYNELKQLVRFYKTGAGQKLAADFPLIMLQSLTAAEMLKAEFTNSRQ